jgi:hypothetical protein
MRSRDPDARLAERALREAWPVPPERRVDLVNKLLDVALGEDTPPRERVSAAKALLMASRLNLEALRVAMAAEEFEELLARLARLEGGDGAAEHPGAD